MKCPKCNGKGTVLKIIYEDWQKDEIVRSAVKCPRCNGSGEVPMTNEEWLRQASTEELAWFIADVCYELQDDIWSNCEDTSCDYRQTDKDYWAEWLKEKHE